jgi:hypothetical protein
LESSLRIEANEYKCKPEENVLSIIKDIVKYVDGERLLDKENLESRSKSLYEAFKSSCEDLDILLNELEAAIAAPVIVL